MADTATAIGWSGLAASLVLIGFVIVLSVVQQLGLERTIAWSSVRALAQLLAVGYALTFIIDPARPVAFAWGWVALMIIVASLTVSQRAPEVPGIFPLAVIATGSSAVVSLGVIFAFGIFPVQGKTIVPLAGMMIGNSMSATVVVARRIVTELTEKRAEVEARLALGQPWQQAARPYVRESLRTAMLPTIESTKVVGLISLPGAMTGLILGGVNPADAVKIQAAVMYLILGSVTTTASVIALGLTRRLFTSDHRLVPLRRTVSR
ncbi:MAG: UDP-glucose/iron transport system permease protein [Acidimicrobiaceae bacterium]